MYSMQIKVLGFTVRLEVVVISLIVGALLGCHVLCGCARKHEVKKKVKEGMQMLGAAVNYSMSDGVPGSYGKGRLQPYAQDLDTHTGPKLPLPPGEMFFFADTVFKPECCVPPFSNASTADGCACVTQEQVNYINARGGNRVPYTDF